MLASEASPLAKTGGLADVMEGLPKALAEAHTVAVFLPYYGGIKHNPAYRTELLAEFSVGLGWRRQYAGLHRLQTGQANPEIYLVDNAYYFDRPSLYGYWDDAERFAFFSKAVLDALAVLHWQPEILHAHDWQAAAAMIFLQAWYRGVFPGLRSVLTIHNIEYQGWAYGSFFDDVLGLPENLRQTVCLTGGVNLLKGGILCADLVTTVSETYAREIRYAYFAHGLEQVLSDCWYKLRGVTNGIDQELFNPQTDAFLVQRYGPADWQAGKAANKAALQGQLGLAQSQAPLLAVVSRLAGHKGMDLLLYSAPALLQQEVQLVVAGTGEAELEERFRALAGAYPGRVSAQICFDPGLASRIYGAADVFLMPSRSEPCGLSQLYAMRYGAVPVVHAVGGLRDTVPPAEEGGLGFTFRSYNGEDFADAVSRCLALRQDWPGWCALVERGMTRDFSWRLPAQRYEALYRGEMGD